MNQEPSHVHFVLHYGLWRFYLKQKGTVSHRYVRSAIFCIMSTDQMINKHYLSNQESDLSNSTLSINTGFSNKRTKLKITAVMRETAQVGRSLYFTTVRWCNGDFPGVAPTSFFKGTGGLHSCKVNIQFEVNKLKIQFTDV